MSDNPELNISLERWTEWNELRKELSEPHTVMLDNEETVKMVVPTKRIATEWNSRYPDESWLHFTRHPRDDRGTIAHGFTPAFAFVMDPHPTRFSNDAVRSATLCSFDEAISLSNEYRDVNIAR